MNARAAPLALALLIGTAHAQTTPATFTNLPVVCTEDKDLTNQPISACSYANQKFLRATATSWVRHCSLSKGCSTTSTDPVANPPAVWKRFDLVPDLDYVEVCTVAKVPGDPISNGACALPGGSTWSGMKYVGKASVNTLPPMPPASFQVSPLSGVSPLTVTVSWNVPGLTGATPCIGEGHPGWAGAKTASSKEEFILYGDAAFTLTCADIDTRHVLVTWRAPTLNTDGTVLTNLASYSLHYGNSYMDLTPVLSQSIAIDRNAQHYIIENLKPDRWMFAMRAQAGNGAESALSSVVSYTTSVTSTPPVPRFTATEHVKVTVQPEPPSGLAVVEPKAYQLHQAPDQLTVIEFGYVPEGTECDPKQAAMGLFLVKRDETTPNAGQTTPPVALAKCEYDTKEGKNLWQQGAPIP